jgi:hypothetical protein
MQSRRRLKCFAVLAQCDAAAAGAVRDRPEWRHSSAIPAMKLPSAVHEIGPSTCRERLALRCVAFEAVCQLRALAQGIYTAYGL